MHSVIVEQIPVLDAAQDGAFAARGVRNGVQNLLRALTNDAVKRGEVEQGLALIDLYIAMIRDGSAAAYAADPKRKEIAKAAGLDVFLDRPASGQLAVRADEALAFHREFVESARAAVEAHELKITTNFEFDGRRYDLDAFLYIQQVALSRWVADLEESARFSTPIKGGTDVSVAPFTRWRPSFNAGSDEKLTSLLDSSMALQGQLFDLAKQIEAAPNEQKLSLYERARTRVISRSQTALQSLIDHATPKQLALAAEENKRIAELDVAGARLEKSLDDLRKTVTDQVEASKNEMISVESSAKRVSLLAIGIGLIVAIVLGLWVGRSISNRLGAITSVMQRLASGDLDTDVPANRTNDEISAMADAVIIFKNNALELRRSETEHKELEARVHHEKQVERNELASSFEASIGSATSDVRDSAKAILEAARDMANRQGDGSSGAIVVAEAADETNLRLTTVGSAVEELSASIGEIAQQAALSSQTARDGVDDVAQAGEQIKRLEQASREIEQVVGLINRIAAQTSLLALNATIEAARAGEAGRGFAVVANEVKQLSNQTTSATEGIARQVAAIQTEAGQTAAAVSRIRTSIGTIADNASGIAAAVEQQRATTDEINRTLVDLTRNMGDVSARIVGIGGNAIHSCAGAIEVLWIAENLEKTSGSLTDDTLNFLTEVRA